MDWTVRQAYQELHPPLSLVNFTKRFIQKEDILTKKLSNRGLNASLTLPDVSVDIHQLLIFWNQILKHVHFRPAGVFIIQVRGAQGEGQRDARVLTYASGVRRSTDTLRVVTLSIMFL